MTDARLVLTTCANPKQAGALAKELVKRRVAACCTVLPGATSVYWWEGKITSEKECVCLLKTQSDRVEALKAAIAEIHPYDTPECLVLPVEAGLDAYLRWVRDETRGVEIPHE